ncbi:two-component response regulator [Desulfocucumis palustris]|uniref:Stage 0 sporulation protein A homolog n=1 Tax=Desulfocucumis palustris TaxID=1898651 RepID=A0A2L2X7W5_9FIRM|nr:response regulator [Desulfocucumis palustris]GBF32100.1 two-component response regulator [Desulfocucumis palustris]
MKVMAVDDIMVIRKMIEKVVNSLGGEIVEARDGVEALTQLKLKANVDVDLIILDMHMPNMDGIEFLNVIKDNQKLKGIPVIMSTSEGEKSKVIKAIQAGARNYLVKPYSEQDLVEKILETLGVGHEHGIFSNCLGEALQNILKKASGLDFLEGLAGGESLPPAGEYFSGQIYVLGQINLFITMNMSRETAAKLMPLIAHRKDEVMSDQDMLKATHDLVAEVVEKAGAAMAGLKLQRDINTPVISAYLLKDSINLVSKKSSFILSRKYTVDELLVEIKMFYL